jgi:hypothetical protein
VAAAPSEMLERRPEEMDVIDDVMDDDEEDAEVDEDGDMSKWLAREIEPADDDDELWLGLL